MPQIDGISLNRTAYTYFVSPEYLFRIFWFCLYISVKQLC